MKNLIKTVSLFLSLLLTFSTITVFAEPVDCNGVEFVEPQNVTIEAIKFKQEMNATLKKDEYLLSKLRNNMDRAREEYYSNIAAKKHSEEEVQAALDNLLKTLNFQNEIESLCQHNYVLYGTAYCYSPLNDSTHLNINEELFKCDKCGDLYQKIISTFIDSHSYKRIDNNHHTSYLIHSYTDICRVCEHEMHIELQCSSTCPLIA